MRLYLIRHGQSVNNALYEQGLERDRHFDPDLTEIGHEQARRVAQYLAESNDMPGRLSEPFKLSHLYCSAMTRAMQTAQPIAAALNIQPEVWVDVHETGGLFLTDVAIIQRIDADGLGGGAGSTFAAVPACARSPNRTSDRASR